MGSFISGFLSEGEATVVPLRYVAPTLRNSENVPFDSIADHFNTIREVQGALIEAGFESCNLIIGIDLTKSNEWNGKRCNGNLSLHALLPDGRLNPYQEAISIIGETMESFDDDHIIPCFGFGCIRSQDRYLVPFTPEDPDGKCRGIPEVLRRYAEMIPKVELSGPTSFAPLIRKAMEIVQITQSYHILVILADGQVTKEAETVEAIVAASQLPLSILMVGVGDGPWILMKQFDDSLPKRKFDNFQFVDFSAIRAKHKNPAVFSLAAFMELPDQYTYIKNHIFVTKDYLSLPIVHQHVLPPDMFTPKVKAAKAKKNTPLRIAID